MVRSNKNKLFIGALALLIGSAQPMEAISFSSVRTWAASVWNSIKQDMSFSKVLLTAGALGGLSYMAYRHGAKSGWNALDQERYRNQNLYNNFIRGRLENRPIARILPPIPAREVRGHMKRIAQNHIHTVWPLFIRLFPRAQRAAFGRDTHYQNYFLYHAMRDMPGLAPVVQAADNNQNNQVGVDWNAIYEYLNGKLYELRQGYNAATITESLRTWAIHADERHNLYQLPVLEQGQLDVPADSRYYALSQQDGANCGYHALKNSQYILEVLRRPQNKGNLIKQLTREEHYLPKLYDWSTRMLLQPNRQDVNGDDWLGLHDINVLAQEIVLQNEITPVPKITPQGIVQIDESGQFPLLNIAINEWPTLIEKRNELRLMNNYRHAFILHVNHKANKKAKGGPGHWVSLVVHKANNEINFYVTNSLSNKRYGYDNYHQIRHIIDFLAEPEVQPENENNQGQDPEAAVS